MRIKNPRASIKGSSERLADLKSIEEQIINMSTMPDFGYQQDNYILEKDDTEDTKNKWKVLTELISNSDKFRELVNYIKL